MLIHEPEVSRIDGKVRLSARVEARSPLVPKGEEVWLEYDEEYADGISPRSDALAVLGCAIGIRVGEDVEIRGEVSPLLLDGLHEHQVIMKSWYHDIPRIVEVRAERVTPAPPSKGFAAASFSGGVDSWDTLLRRLAEPAGSMRVTHAVLQSGFDTDPDDETRSRVVREIYEPVVNRLGARYCGVRTNLLKFNVGAPVRTTGYLLVAPILALGSMFGRLHIGASFEYSSMVPFGSHPMLDHLLSTESFRSIHDGAHLTRIEKIKGLIDHAETYEALRVCRSKSWSNIDLERRIVRNCGNCSKCVRTMTSLELLGALDRYKTFVGPLRRSAIRRSHSIGLDRPFVWQNLRQAIAAGRGDLAFDLRWQLARGWIREAKAALARRAKRLTPFRRSRTSRRLRGSGIEQ